MRMEIVEKLEQEEERGRRVLLDGKLEAIVGASRRHQFVGSG